VSRSKAVSALSASYSDASTLFSEGSKRKNRKQKKTEYEKKLEKKISLSPLSHYELPLTFSPLSLSLSPLFQKKKRKKKRDRNALVQRVDDDPPRLNRRPLPPLVVESGGPDKGHHQDPLGSHQLAVVVLWLGGPGEEGRDLLVVVVV